MALQYLTSFNYMYMKARSNQLIGTHACKKSNIIMVEGTKYIAVAISSMTLNLKGSDIDSKLLMVTLGPFVASYCIYIFLG